MSKISGPMKAAMQRNISKLYRVFMPAVILCVLLAAGMQSPSAVRPTEPVLPQNQAVKKALPTYTCPMHPEVKSTKRGKCPKCGMALRLDAAPPAASSVPNANNELAASVTTDKKPNDADNGSGAARKMDIPDVEVLDQDGRVIHFYSDLVKGKTVAINFIFTNCTTICPPLAATFARVQKEMGDKVGRDVHFISVSVDPLTDTPQRLKAWGAKFKAGAGWTFVTGDKQEIDKLLNALGASVGRREDHSPAVLVGNDAKGVWTRTYGLAKTSQMVGLILNVMEGKTDEAIAKENDKP
jgi:cytochrome oxidase Cu insertion factor (SCO1/SenC/PrrC family)